MANINNMPCFALMLMGAIIIGFAVHSLFKVQLNERIVDIAEIIFGLILILYAISVLVIRNY